MACFPSPSPPLRLSLVGEPIAAAGSPWPGGALPLTRAAGGPDAAGPADAADSFLPAGLVRVRQAFALAPAARSWPQALRHDLEIGADELLLLELADGSSAVLDPSGLDPEALAAALGAADPGGTVAIRGPLPDAGRGLVSRLFVLAFDPGFVDGILEEARRQALDWARERLGEAVGERLWDLAERGVSWCALRGLVGAIETRSGVVAGLHRWRGGEPDPEPLATPERPLPAEAGQEPLLLLLHGLGSRCGACFAGLLAAAPAGWPAPLAAYGDRVLAFEQHTFSAGPIDNAIALVRSLPAAARLHLVSHGSGGLVGDLLCQAGFAPERIAAYGRSSPGLEAERDPRRRERLRHSLDALHGFQREQLRQLDELLRERGLRVERYLRVAAPAAGTRLLGRHLDVFLSLLLGGLGVIPGLAGSPLLGAGRRILLEMVRLRADPRLVPGLAALMPDSPLARFLADAPASAQPELALISGERSGDSPLRRLLRLLPDAFVFRGVPNDGLVDTEAMAAGIALARPCRSLRLQGPDLDHGRYFLDPRGRDACLRWLAGGPLPSPLPSLPPPPPPPAARAPVVEAAAAPAAERVLRVGCLAMDLRFASDPVLVGHYERDAIAGPESVIDRHLVEGQLSIRHQLGIHAGPPGSSSVVLIDPNPEERRRGSQRGAVVIGLGEMGALTAAGLTEAVRAGTLRYLLQRLDRLGGDGAAAAPPPLEATLATLLVGTNSSTASPISVEDALAAILRGVMAANRHFLQTHPDRCVMVARLEVIEVNLDIAITAARALPRLAEEVGRDFRDAGLRLEADALLHGDGSHRHHLGSPAGSGYWTRFVISDQTPLRPGERPGTGVAHRLGFVRHGSRARVEAEQLQRQPGLVESLVDLSVGRPVWNPNLSRALFHLLLPHEFKEPVRQAERLVLVLDDRTANLPWELIGDGDAPLCVQQRMVRQLQAVGGRPPGRQAPGATAYVVGNPATTGFAQVFGPEPGALPPLPGAEAEALAVAAMLRRRGYEVEESIGADDSGVDVIEKMYRRPYRIVHIGAHGVFDRPSRQGDRRSGVVLSDGMLITAVEICSLEQAPDLVFLNCCHLGRIDAGTTTAAAVPHHRLAASLATELIRMGVRVVVVAGWAVDDPAARLFTETFYAALLANRPFGEAVHQARLATHHRFPESTTWGAFQAYGDPIFRLDPGAAEPGEGPASGPPAPFVHPEECLQELRRLRVALHRPSRPRPGGGAVAPSPRPSLEPLLGRIPPDWQRLPALAVAIAEACREMGRDQHQRAADWYRSALHGEPDATTPGDLCEATAPIRAIEQLSLVESLLGLEGWEEGRRRGDADAMRRGGDLLDAAIARLEGLLALVDVPAGPASPCGRLVILAAAHEHRAVLRAQRLASCGAGASAVDGDSVEAFAADLARAIDLYRRVEVPSASLLRGLALQAIADLTAPQGVAPGEAAAPASAGDEAMVVVSRCAAAARRDHRLRRSLGNAAVPAEALLVGHLLQGTLPRFRDPVRAAYREALEDVPATPAEREEVVRGLANLRHLADGVLVLAARAAAPVDAASADRARAAAAALRELHGLACRIIVSVDSELEAGPEEEGEESPGASGTGDEIVTVG